MDIFLQFQNRRGHALSPVWVFGMVDASHIPAIGYMEIVDQRDAATLLPIIRDHVLPGTTIWSDMWAAYNGVTALPGVASHETVNHSIQFINPVNGVHTNTIESYWNRYHKVSNNFKVIFLLHMYI